MPGPRCEKASGRPCTEGAAGGEGKAQRPAGWFRAAGGGAGRPAPRSLRRRPGRPRPPACGCRRGGWLRQTAWPCTWQ
eukprot:1071118-Lingulodinium_polyedra.AAC.1